MTPHERGCTVAVPCTECRPVSWEQAAYAAVISQPTAETRLIVGWGFLGGLLQTGTLEEIRAACRGIDRARNEAK